MNKLNNNVQSKNIRLSIQFSLDGFSFCIENLASKNILCFKEYIFSPTLLTPKLLQEKIVEIFNSDKNLQQDFNEIKVIHQNNLSTLVPNEYFDRTKLKNYLNYNIKTLENDYFTFDDIDSIGAKTVYIPYVNINNYLFQHFGEFEFKHHSSVLIEKLIQYSNDQIEHSFFVNVSSKNIDIIVIKNNKLLFYNSFYFETKEDFIYYILFVVEQLELDTNTFQLTFLGMITKNDETYKITYKYVRNINFIKTKSTTSNPSTNYILIS